MARNDVSGMHRSQPGKRQRWNLILFLWSTSRRRREHACPQTAFTRHPYRKNFPRTLCYNWSFGRPVGRILLPVRPLLCPCSTLPSAHISCVADTPPNPQSLALGCEGPQDISSRAYAVCRSTNSPPPNFPSEEGISYKNRKAGLKRRIGGNGELAKLSIQKQCESGPGSGEICPSKRRIRTGQPLSYQRQARIAECACGSRKRFLGLLRKVRDRKADKIAARSFTRRGQI